MVLQLHDTDIEWVVRHEHKVEKYAMEYYKKNQYYLKKMDRARLIQKQTLEEIFKKKKFY